jgi:PAS domain-containing protein
MDQVVTAILTEPLDLQQAQLIGILLASLHPLQPPILVVTQQVVLEHGLADLDPAVDAALRPRVIAALGAITTGFLLQMQMRLQSDLEPVRQALLSHSQRLERQLYDLDQQFTLILANAPVILWATDRDGYFELAQGLGLTRFGLTPEDVIGQPVHVVEARAPQLRPLLQRALRGEMSAATHHAITRLVKCRAFWRLPLT